MKNKKILIYIITCFAYNLTLFSDPAIILSLHPYPQIPNAEYCQKVLHRIKSPAHRPLRIPARVNPQQAEPC